MEKNVYQKTSYAKSEYFNIGFTTDDIKASSSQLDQETIAQRMRIFIKHLKLKVLELEDDICIHKIKLSNICDRERFSF